MPCWLATRGYNGPGHTGCYIGVQGGHTAHHIGRDDVDGLLPVCGRAHDLCANITGLRAQLHFRAWMEEHGHTLESVALEFIEQVRGME